MNNWEYEQLRDEAQADLNVDAWDIMSARFQASFATNITSELKSRLDFGDESKTGAELNEELELQGDEAFDPNETMSTTRYNHLIETKRAEDWADYLSENTEGVGNALAGFAGDLAGGVADPITLFAGFGVGKAAAWGATKLASTALNAARVQALVSSSKVLSNKGVQLVAKEVVENIAGATIVDVPAMKAVRNARNEEFQAEDALNMIAVNTFLGTALGSLAQYKKIARGFRDGADTNTAMAIKKTRQEIESKTDSSSSVNVEREVTKAEIHAAREHQKGATYTKVDVDVSEVKSGKTFYVSYRDTGELVNVKNDSGVVLTDSPISAENVVSTLDKSSSKGAYTEVTLPPQANVIKDGVEGSFDDIVEGIKANDYESALDQALDNGMTKKQFDEVLFKKVDAVLNTSGDTNTLRINPDFIRVEDPGVGKMFAESDSLNVGFSKETIPLDMLENSKQDITNTIKKLHDKIGDTPNVKPREVEVKPSRTFDDAIKEIGSEKDFEGISKANNFISNTFKNVGEAFKACKLRISGEQ